MKEIGSLVDSNQNSLLAVMQQVDPIYVSFQVSESDFLAWKRAEKSGELILADGAKAPYVEITLIDGTPFDRRQRDGRHAVRDVPGGVLRAAVLRHHPMDQRDWRQTSAETGGQSEEGRDGCQGRRGSDVMKKSKWFPVVCIAFLVAGCMTGPDYKRPDLDVPGKWSEPLDGGEIARTRRPNSPVPGPWWASLGDATLDSLVARAIEGSFDLRAAEARLREARAIQDVTSAGLWPQVDTSAAYQRTQTRKIESSSAGGGAAKTPRRQADLFQAGFDASWELDLFGGIRREKEAAKADTESAEEARCDVLITVAAEVARNYFELRSAQNRLETAANNIQAQKEALDIARARFEAGLTSELDAKIAEAQLASSQSVVPALETAAQIAIHRLGVLAGAAPGAMQEELSRKAALPNTPPEVPVGLPVDILRRRPDVRRAERQVAAATAS